MIATPAFQETDEYRKRVISRVNRRLIPFAFLCYVVAYIDRVNVGFAAQALQRDLHLSDTGVRLRRGPLLYRILPLRSAEQPDPGACRRPPLDRAHHDRLGLRLDRHDVRHRPEIVLCGQDSARVGGGRVLPRIRPLSHLLDPGRPIVPARALCS